jgi:hypothetical protein
MIFDPALPRTNVQVRRVTATIFTIASFISMMLCAIGCGVAVWRYNDISTGVITEISIWKVVSSGSTTATFDIACGNLSYYFKTAAGFSIASAILSLFCLIFGLLRMCVKLPAFILFVCGGITSLTTLITWAVLTNMWYARFCNAMSSYEQSFYIRMPGYGFFVTSFSVIFLATVLVVVGSIKNGKAETKYPARSIILVATIFLSALFGIVAMPTAFFNNVDQNNTGTVVYTRIYLWGVKSQDATYFYTETDDIAGFFGCNSLAAIIKGARYLQLCGAIIATAATVAALVIFKSPKWRYGVIVLNDIACALYGTALLLWIIIFQQKFCNAQSLADVGLSVSTGAALQIVGFAMTLYGVVFPCLPGEESGHN